MSAVKAAQLDLFALTDHDTLQGFNCLQQLPSLPCTVVSGIELSCVWSGVSVHIVGLDFNPTHPSMQTAIAFLRQSREERAKVIDAKLAKLGMPNTLAGALTFCPDIGQVGRPHFADFLMQAGYVKTRNEAFDRWLGSGKMGDIKTVWPSLTQVVAWIVESGGVAVLAHPLRYKMTFSKLRQLIIAFKTSGGAAIELVGQQAQPEQKKALIKLAKELELAASGGSDFHDPGWAWAQIGRIEPLPEAVPPVWSLFKQTVIN